LTYYFLDADEIAALQQLKAMDKEIICQYHYRIDGGA
jgi:hypothetical protein